MMLIYFLIAIPKIFSLVVSGDFVRFFMEHSGPRSLMTWASEFWRGSDSATRSLITALLNYSWFPFLASLICYVVLSDFMSGHYYKNCHPVEADKESREMERVQEEDDDDL